MNHVAKNMSLFFTAGCLGGLFNSIVVWLFGVIGITQALGVSIAPPLTPAWLYPRIVWGGLWGFLFFLPVVNERILLKGILLSIGPTLVQLFIVFPVQAGKGMLGFDLGILTPVFVIVFNMVWGLAAALWIRQAEMSS